MRNLKLKSRSFPAGGGRGKFDSPAEGSPGATKPVPKPERVVEADAPNGYPECGYPLELLYTAEKVVEELPDLQPVQVTAYKKTHYLCTNPNCECEVVSAHQDCPPEGRFGKNVYVQTTIYKFCDRLPLEKIRSAFGRQGMGISFPALLTLLDRTADWLRPEYERILWNLRNSSVVYTDQTGIKVDGLNFWIWDFVTGFETLFVIRGRKSEKVLEEVLGKGWSGTLVCDGLRSHHSFAKKGGAKIQRCWAHLLREAKDLAEKYEEAEAINEGLHKLYDRLKKALEKEPPPKERARLTRNAKRAMRRLMKSGARRQEYVSSSRKSREGILTGSQPSRPQVWS